LGKIVDISIKFEGEIYLTTRGLILGSEKVVETNDEKILEELSNFFRIARAHSMQYDLDYKTTSIVYKQKPNLKRGRIKVPQVHTFGMLACRESTFLHWNDLNKIYNRKINGEDVPIAKEIFLDGFEAHLNKDFRKCILYAAMASEIHVSTIIENQYQTLLTKDKLKTALLNPSTGEKKDPIFELLQENRWQFKNKLHQHFLYLFNRSLLVENKTLYDNLISLYETRNKIVHQGYIDGPNKRKLLALDRFGSGSAIDLTISLFSWLGDDSLMIFNNRKLETFGS
jgi:hypothetical protein